MINLPHASDSLREVGAKTVLANNPLDRVDRTDKAADRLSEQAQDEAQRDDDERSCCWRRIWLTRTAGDRDDRLARELMVEEQQVGRAGLIDGHGS
jgi:hypothetical protein